MNSETVTVLLLCWCYHSLQDPLETPTKLGPRPKQQRAMADTAPQAPRSTKPRYTERERLPIRRYWPTQRSGQPRPAKTTCHLSSGLLGISLSGKAEVSAGELLPPLRNCCTYNTGYPACRLTHGSLKPILGLFTAYGCVSK